MRNLRKFLQRLSMEELATKYVILTAEDTRSIYSNLPEAPAEPRLYNRHELLQEMMRQEEMTKHYPTTDDLKRAVEAHIRRAEDIYKLLGG